MVGNFDTVPPAVPAVTWEMLQKSLAHPNVLIRQKAVETAGRFRDVRAVAVLHSHVRDETPAIRTAAAQALVRIATLQDPQIEAALAQLITSAADDELRVFLIANVSASGGDVLLRAVIACLVDSAANIRHAAEAALKGQGGAWMLTQAATDMLPTIEGARSAFNAEVSAAATKWSAQLQRAQLRRTMLNSGLATILTLAGALQSPNALVRGAAAEALLQCNDARAVPALRDALRDPDEDVRRRAATVLGHLEWRPNSEEELISWLVAMGRWESVLAHGEAAVEALLFAARNSSETVQVKVIEHLAELNSLGALLPLVSLLEAPQKPARRALARALRNLEWVPTNPDQGIRYAVELDDWAKAASYGANSVAALMSELKASHGQADREQGLREAMNTISDPGAVHELVRFCSDGEVARAAFTVLSNLLARGVTEVSEEALQALVSLKTVVQFGFSHGPAPGQRTRSGMEILDISPLRAIASAELARRAAPVIMEERSATEAA